MKVTLIYATPGAIDLLLFTKSTRLQLTPGLMDEIRSWPEERKLNELRYMAKTVPSSWEFVDLIFSIEDVTRAFTHQLVRTRTASYAQQADAAAANDGGLWLPYRADKGAEQLNLKPPAQYMTLRR